MAANEGRNQSGVEAQDLDLHAAGAASVPPASQAAARGPARLMLGFLASAGMALSVWVAARILASLLA